MGWTGMFNWSSYEKNWEILNREFFGNGKSNYEPLKWSDKGNHVWVLFKHKETQKVYAAVVMCKRYKKDHEFMYKEIGLECGPGYMDMPKSWLPLLTYDESEKYAMEYLEKYKKQMNTPKEKPFEFGDVIKCKNNNTTISWSDGYSIKPEEEFFVMVEPHKTRKRTTKLYTLVKKQDYGWQRMYRRLSQKTFKYVAEKTLVNK